MKKKQEEIIKRYQMRHACKQMDPSRKIPSDQFDTLLEVARLSPSSMGMEPWKILVETGMMDPKHFGLSYMLAFGYRAVEPKREKTRQKREDIVQWYQ